MDPQEHRIQPILSCDIRLNPQSRLCPRYDSESIAMYPIARPGEMGFRVIDNCTEEHIQ